MNPNTNGTASSAHDAFQSASARVAPSQQKLASDFRTLITDAEQLLHNIADASGEGLNAARDRFAGQLDSAKALYTDAGRSMRGQVDNATEATSNFVGEYPMRAIAIAVSVGAVLGFLLYPRKS
jgi:ElaB/YqjD/DUF883 family membrane-anchored ribosome-binding protein